MKSFRWVITLVLLVACAQVCLASSELETGIQLYKKGQMRDALQHLKSAASDSARYNPDAHYMLANTLLALGSIDAAVAEYRICYNMAPEGPNSKHCLEVLARESVSAKAPNKVPAVTKPVQETSTQSASSASAPEIPTPNLPTIPRFVPEVPSNEEVLSWNDVPKGRFMNQADDRRARAKERIAKAESMLRTAYAQLRSLIPNGSVYGESPDQQRARVDAAKARVEQLRRPYEQELENAQQAYTAANTLFEACRASAMGLNNNWVPVGR
jgi:tetratricopeptide (TPR) repeat protein